ncbi:hypothetical protein NP493_41g06049 [Ridgeia piscesae]|uniref:EF-hand domain-containing protein n=1 Tax=Ridgeia piscesae TaxID=27915 RepID=A0AAD9PBZ5_RIDPI|nr:hypothetical protein NP493_41g06049 [Ridgeia piscesae]
MAATESRRTPDSSQRELATTFALLDRNRDGRICANDMKTSMRVLNLPISEQVASNFVKKLAKGGCDIREEEFALWMRTCNDYNNNSILQQAFDALDTNKDGYITKAELQTGLTLLGEVVSDTVLSAMMEEADLDHDNRLSFQEFSHAVSRRA